MSDWERLWRGELGLPPLPVTEPWLLEQQAVAQRDGREPPSAELMRLLALLAGARGVARILQVGAGSGLSVVALARGAAAAEIVIVDRGDSPPGEVKRLFSAAGIEERVDWRAGDPLDLVPRFTRPFDVVHLDDEPQILRRLLDCALTRLAVGGTVSVDGVAPPGDAAPAFCGYFLMHPQLESVVLPLGRGLALGRKVKPLVTDVGGPF